MRQTWKDVVVLRKQHDLKELCERVSQSERGNRDFIKEKMNLRFGEEGYG